MMFMHHITCNTALSRITAFQHKLIRSANNVVNTGCAQPKTQTITMGIK
jgi:hypothetical protein